MYAWKAEAGEDFDIDIASEDLKAAVVNLVDRSPASDTAVILPLGDVFHFDNFEGITTRSGNRLDMDTRLPRVFKLGSGVILWCIESALRKHKNVVVRIVRGNHDDVLSMALGLLVDAYFRNEPRVTVDTSPAPRWYFEFGKVLIAATHGDDANPERLRDIMAAEQSEAWGRTKFRYWYTGHIHTHNRREWPGCSFESFRTLAPVDDWANRKAYRSGRDMNCIVHHREWGEMLRYRADVAMLRGIK